MGFRLKLNALRLLILFGSLSSAVLGNITFGQGVTPCPQFNWATEVGYTSMKTAIDQMKTDHAGNVYMLGTFKDTAIFGVDTFISKSTERGVLLKMDDSRNIIWAKVLQYNPARQFLGIDDSDAIYVHSLFLSFDNSLRTTKYSKDGQVIWDKQIVNDQLSSTAMVIGPNAKIFLTTTYYGQVIVGDDTLKSIGSTNSGLLTLDSSGNILDFIAAGSGPGTVLASHVAVDDSGFVYVGGGYGATAGCYLLKIDIKTNTHSWLKTLNNNLGALLVANDSLYVATNDGSLRLFDWNGNESWVKSKTAGNGSLSITSLVKDVFGNLYCAGSYYGYTSGIYLDTFYINKNRSGLFWGKLDTGKNWVWIKQPFANANFKAQNLVLINNNILVSGIFRSIGRFDDTLIYANSIDDHTFLAELRESSLSLQPLTDQKIVCGQKVEIQPQAANYTDFSWSPLQGIQDSLAMNGIFYPSSNTEYTLELENYCGATLSRKFNVEVDPMRVNAGPDVVIDCGTEHLLEANLLDTMESVTYQWTPPSFLKTPNMASTKTRPPLSQHYQVTATTPNGCIAVDEMFVQVNNPNPPTVTITSNTGKFELCSGSLTLSVDGFEDYLWSNGSSLNTITVVKAGWYKVVAINEDGCAGTDSVEVKAPITAISAPGGTVFCPGQTGQKLKLIATADMDSYLWSTGEQTQTIEVDKPGIYSVTVNKAGCSSTAQISATTSNGNASADFSYTTSGLAATFTAISPSVNFLSWNFGDGTTSTLANPVHTYSQSGNYDVTIAITDFCGKNAEKTKTIRVDGQVGLTEDSQRQFKVYPNPTKDLIEIESVEELASLVLIDAVGKELVKQNLQSERSSLSLGLYPPGVYMLIIRTKSGIYSERIIRY